ncbi:uncharacterized protein LOC122295785 [Carya illinoinensis]|uniref:uncharacterized protein LOC122295785 n=1 Tax=Carya illinoinensis TaxID=32201 RepID=UPI001C71B5AA|nr:uncharacterized protein LOC122295785 [Carya illinoinensis]XP_042960975.1 uncharacterized protein LOC122295785 [Carya illinoinensis]
MSTIERGRGRGRVRACGVNYNGGRSQRNEVRNRVPIAALRDDAFSSLDDSTEQPNVVPNDMPAVDVPLSTNSSVPPCRKRGRGEAKCTEFEKVRKHGKIPLRIKDGETAPCCENALIFTTRITWLVKHYMDLCHASWHNVPVNEKEELISRVQNDFILDWTKKNHRDAVTKTLRKRFNHIRYDLHRTYKLYDSNEEALANVPSWVTPATWVKLCARYSSENFKRMSERNKFNREKQQNNHTAGRRSFVRLMEMRSGNDETVVDFFKEVRWSKKKDKFVTPMMEKQYNKMAANMSKLEPEKQTKEAAMTIFKEVLGQRSGYVRGLGEMVIPESSRQATDAQIAELTERAERHEKEAADYKGQLDDLRENVMLLQAKYDKFIEI